MRPDKPNPENTPIQQILDNLVAAAQACFQSDLNSIILFGSGAEGQIRPTSDLNLLFVLHRFVKDKVDSFREPLRVGHVTARASVMFLLDTELQAAAEAFAVKFDDMVRRRRVLYGVDVIAPLMISREVKKRRLCQVLLNLILRLREQYAQISLREEQLVRVIADVAGPLRSSAATLLELEGRQVPSPKKALEVLTEAMGYSGRQEILNSISQARETCLLPPGVAGRVLFELIALAEAIRSRAERV